MPPTRRLYIPNQMVIVVIAFVSFSLIMISSSTESSGVDLKNFTKDTNVTELWELFKETYNKTYESEDESNKRYDIFAANVKKIAEHNEEYEKGQTSYKTGVNAFVDQTPEEFRASRLGSLG